MSQDPRMTKYIFGELKGDELAEFEKYPARQHPKPYIAAIGRHVPQKGFDVLLRALAKADVQHDLILAGDVCYEAPMTGHIMPWLSDMAILISWLPAGPVRMR